MRLGTVFRSTFQLGRAPSAAVLATRRGCSSSSPSTPPPESQKSSSSAAPTKGFQATLNGFGVMMDSVEKDPFVAGWIDASTRADIIEDEQVCALEIGCAFGAASLAVLRNGGRHVVANDLDAGHLKALREKWDADVATLSLPEGRALPKLDTVRGRMPDALKLPAFKTLPPPKTILAANVIHFLSPDQVRTLFRALYELAAPGAALFVSSDSPWTRAYAPFTKLYTLKRILRHPAPGYHPIPPVARFVLPERLRQIPCYHVMEEWQLVDALEEAGWNVEQSGFFAGDENNPARVNLDGREMVGARASKIVRP